MAVERVSVGGGNCGCGRPGHCYEDFECSCSYDHGQWFLCDDHAIEAELERQSEALQSRTDAASDWARDERLFGDLL